MEQATPVRMKEEWLINLDQTPGGRNVETLSNDQGVYSTPIWNVVEAEEQTKFNLNFSTHSETFSTPVGEVIEAGEETQFNVKFTIENKLNDLNGNRDELKLKAKLNRSDTYTLEPKPRNQVNPTEERKQNGKKESDKLNETNNNKNESRSSNQTVIHSGEGDQTKELNGTCIEKLDGGSDAKPTKHPDGNGEENISNELNENDNRNGNENFDKTENKETKKELYGNFKENLDEAENTKAIVNLNIANLIPIDDLEENDVMSMDVVKFKQLQQENHELKEQLKKAIEKKEQVIKDANKNCQEFETLLTLSEESAERYKRISQEMCASLETVEKAYNDLFKRFDKAKSTIEGFKDNEATYKNIVEKLQDCNKQWKEKYDMLKQHTTERFAKGNEEYLKLKNESFIEAQRADAIIKKETLNKVALEKRVEQLTEELQILANLYDEVTGKM